MPKSIKWFVWLALAYVALGTFWNFKLFLWPSAHYIDLLARLPPSLHQATQQADLIAAFVREACFILPFAFFAVLAAFFRRGWARWGVIFVLVVTETILPFLYAGYAYFFQPEGFRLFWRTEVQNALQNDYRFDAAHAMHWVVLTTMALLVSLLFVPTSRPWFRKAARPG